MNFQSFCFFQTASTLRVFDAWHPTSHWQAEKEWKWDFKPTFGLFWNGSKRGREGVGQAVRPGKNYGNFPQKFYNKIINLFYKISIIFRKLPTCFWTRQKNIFRIFHKIFYNTQNCISDLQITWTLDVNIQLPSLFEVSFRGETLSF